MSRARLLIAENYAPLLEALRVMLAVEYELVALVEDGEAALEAAVRLEPDLVLLDISLPSMSGLEVMRALRQRAPELKAIIMTSHTDPLYVEKAFALGANGYVVKDNLDSELLDAVKRVLDGGRHQPPSHA